MIITLGRIYGCNQKASYAAIEKSWAEQREYIRNAVCCLNASKKAQAQEALAKLIPQKPYEFSERYDISKPITAGKWRLKIGASGSVEELTCGDNTVIRQNDFCAAEYIGSTMTTIIFGSVITAAIWIKTHTGLFPTSGVRY